MCCFYFIFIQYKFQVKFLGFHQVDWSAQDLISAQTSFTSLLVYLPWQINKWIWNIVYQWISLSGIFFWHVKPISRYLPSSEIYFLSKKLWLIFTIQLHTKKTRTVDLSALYTTWASNNHVQKHDVFKAHMRYQSRQEVIKKNLAHRVRQW